MSQAAGALLTGIRTAGQPKTVLPKPAIGSEEERFDERETTQFRQQSQTNSLPHFPEHLNASNDVPIGPTGVNGSA